LSDRKNRRGESTSKLSPGTTNTAKKELGSQLKSTFGADHHAVTSAKEMRK
tara:strand:+ start:96 stop:248 length:153 start_codon:yes stop_codon:yes gene_type:complete